MFPTWRIRLREARVACDNGRYDEAGVMLSEQPLREFLPAKQLARDVAGKIVERAADRFKLGDSSAGWRDLATADRLGGQLEAIGHVRHEYAAHALAEIKRDLLAGQYAPAIAQLDKLHKRGLTDELARVYRQIVQLLREAENSAHHGHFTSAAETTRRAADFARLNRDSQGTMDEITAKLDAESGRLSSLAAESQRLSAELHTALAAESWGATLSAADALLAIAPKHAAAVQARRRAWKAVGMDVTQVHTGRNPAKQLSLAVDKSPGQVGRRSTRHASRTSEGDTVVTSVNPERALLWVDAVGGFLVCFDDAITIGQPSPGERIAVPILADLSRRHAVIRRDAGAYVIDPLQQTRIDGREINGPTVLADNQIIQLGDNVRLRFTKPHALSATAKLTTESHHKTQPSADAILLMADSCVLGPNRHCHVRCRGWQRDVVLFRQDGNLQCRADEPLTIDGVIAGNDGELKSGMRVEGEEFSFAWETVV